MTKVFSSPSWSPISIGYPAERRLMPPIIRLATDDDWPSIWPFFEAIVREGETYTYPTDLTSETGRSLWMEPASEPDGGPRRPGDDCRVGQDGTQPTRPGRPHRNRQFHGDTGSTWPRCRTIAR